MYGFILIMAFFNFIETFFFVSLGITFVLIVLLMYHFKQRTVNLEQKQDTMFEIMNNVVKEMTVIKKSVIAQHHAHYHPQQQEQQLTTMLENAEQCTDGWQSQLIDAPYFGDNENMKDNVDCQNEWNEDDEDDECDDEEPEEDGDEEENNEDDECDDEEPEEDCDEDENNEEEEQNEITYDHENECAGEMTDVKVGSHSQQNMDIRLGQNPHWVGESNYQHSVLKINDTEENNKLNIDTIEFSAESIDVGKMADDVAGSHQSENNAENYDHETSELRCCNINIEPDTIIEAMEQHEPIHVNKLDVTMDIELDIEDLHTAKEKKHDSYRKMNLSQLKSLVISKGIATDTSKMKKHDLLKLLEKTDLDEA